MEHDYNVMGLEGSLQGTKRSFQGPKASLKEPKRSLQGSEGQGRIWRIFVGTCRILEELKDLLSGPEECSLGLGEGLERFFARSFKILEEMMRILYYPQQVQEPNPKKIQMRILNILPRFFTRECHNNSPITKPAYISVLDWCGISNVQPCSTFSRIWALDIPW